MCVFIQKIVPCVIEENIEPMPVLNEPSNVIGLKFVIGYKLALGRLPRNCHLILNQLLRYPAGRQRYMYHNAPQGSACRQVEGESHLRPEVRAETPLFQRKIVLRVDIRGYLQVTFTLTFPYLMGYEWLGLGDKEKLVGILT
jgi:hypothetical protein